MKPNEQEVKTAHIDYLSSIKSKDLRDFSTTKKTSEIKYIRDYMKYKINETSKDNSLLPEFDVRK